MAITATQQTDIIKAVVGVFNASPGGYMSTLASAVQAGTTTAQLYDALASNAAFKSLSFAYSDGATNAQFASALASNLLGNSVSAANLQVAKDFVVANLNANVSKGAIIKAAVDFLSGMSKTDANWGGAATLFANKVTVATAYTIDQSGSATSVSALLATIATVDTTQASVDNAIAVNSGATYSLAAGATSYNEGDTATFTLTTTNVVSGTEVAYTISGVSAGDVTGALTGKATVSQGSATISVVTTKDLTTEGAETMKVALDNGKSSATATVADTSMTPVYTVTADAASADEGTAAKFTVTADQTIADGATVAYTLSGVTAADVTGGALSGTATFAGGKAAISVDLAKDATTEGAETLSVVVGTSTGTATVNDKSITPVMGTDAVSGTIVSGQGTAIITPASLLTNDFDSTGTAVTGTPTLVAGSATNGEIFTSKEGNFVFVATAGSRTGSFQYEVAGITEKGTVNVTLNSAPVITSAATLAATEDTAATGTVTATDADSDALTYTFGTATKGTVTAGTGGAFTYTPNANANGTDTFKVTVADAYGSATQDIAVTIAAVNDDPQALTPAPAAIATTSGKTGITVDLASYATDPDLAAGDITGLVFALSAAATTKGGVATLGADGHTVTIAYPQGGGAAALGADSLGFTVKDAVSAAIPATVTLTVSNTAPTATDIALPAKTGVTQTVDLTGKISDAEGNTLTPVVTPGTVSSGGSAEVLNGKIVYTSTVGFTGTETLKYTVTDGFGASSAEQTITFTVASNTGGTSGNDLLYGSTAAENIDGLAGNDTIVGGGGADTLVGGDGDDQVTFHDNAPQIQGGAGSDSLVVGANAIARSFDLSITNDANLDPNSTTAIVRGFENIDASKSSNAFYLDETAGGFTDNATGGDVAGTTSVLTGSGDDQLEFSRATGTVTVSTGDGADTVNVEATATGKFSISGGAGNDTINVSATAAVHTLLGGAGNDTISLGTGVSSVDGGDGNDTINTNATNASNALTGGAGDDTFKFISANLTLDDTIAGGDGTDKIEVTDDATVVDADFTKATSVETLTSTAASQLDATVGSIAQAAGLTTVTFAGTDAADTDSLVIAADFTATLTVNLDSDAAVGNTVDGTAFTKALTVKAALSNVDTTAQTITGGTSTGDIIEISVDSTASAAAGLAANVTKVEKITLVDGATATSHTGTVTLQNASTGATETMTVDASALVATTGGGAVDKAVIDAALEADGKVVVIGGSGADTITGSQSANGDNLSGGAGNDSFLFASAQLTNADTVAGGDGTDSIGTTDTGTVVDADFTKVTSVETLTANGTMDFDATIGSLAQAAGLATVTFVGSDGGDSDSVVVGADFAADLTVNLDSDANVGNTVTATNYTKVLTVKAALSNVDTNAQTITGGTGSDVLQISVDSTAATATLANITKVEKITLVDGATATSNTATITLQNASTLAAETMTVDASALVATTGGGAVDKAIIDAALEADGKVVVIGGNGADTITGSQSANGDNLSGGAGNDSFLFATAQLTSADTVAGGDGTDSIGTTDSGTVVDTDFTKVTSVETLTANGTMDFDATIGSLAQAAGLATVTFVGSDGGDSDSLVVGADFAADLTVNLDSDANVGNTITATNYTKVLTVKAALGNIDNGAQLQTITGGTGSDVLQISVDSSVAASSLANVTKVEKITLVDGATATSNAATVNLNNANATYTNSTTYETITVDASALVATSGGGAVDTATIDASAEADAKVIITGGNGADTITGSGSANFGDSISGGDGNDTIKFAVVGNLKSSDTVAGGAGDDTIDLSGVVLEADTNLDDTVFTNVTSVKTFKPWTFNDADDGAVMTATATVSVGALAQAAGITAIALSATDGSTTANADTFTFVVDASAYTTGVAVTTNHAVTTSVLNVQVTTGSGNDTITAAAGDDAVTVNGGAGSDTIDLSTATVGTVVWNLGSNLVSGSTLVTNGDYVKNWTQNTDKIELLGLTLQSGVGGQITLSSSGDSINTAADVATITDGSETSQLSSIVTGTESSAYVINVNLDTEMGTDVFVVSGALSQAGVDKAVAQLKSLVLTTSGNTSIVFAVNDGTNFGLFLYQEGTLDQGIQDGELTLMGVLDAMNTNLAIADLT